MAPLRSAYHRWAVPKMSRLHSSMLAREAFRYTYANQLWGNKSDQLFYSGRGSDEEFTAEYCRMVNRFVNIKHIQVVVDVGCGDFRVGRKIAVPGRSYIGIDIVPELVAYNQQHFGTAGISFRCLDITKDVLCKGELCLIRQVFQHLSNEQISRALLQCEQYEYVLVTEHVPRQPAKPNVDKPCGPSTRLGCNSGVFLEAPPFRRCIENLLEVPVDADSVLRTVLMKNSTTCTISGRSPAS